ncbi:hypothetical protein EJP82_26480 [Paenibacillus anaericanus]|uniref:Uncharacterized protein n=1 Tax=Paenibacillus anaericanus TaxID=170367 RepID=A0A433XX27_9BACL|nr:hypothetical protein [Paenibacillus anaericanus]RUT39245.1 hypothetical protein EJP82_26480 [Paenibacillus anaericanus]
MSTFKLLAQYEFRALMPRISRRNILSALLVIAFLVIGGAFLDLEISNPQAIFAAGTVCALAISMIVSIVHVGKLWTSKYREWWLTLPHSRMLLTISKVMGLTRVSYWIGAGVLLISTGIYGLKVWMGTIDELSVRTLLSMILVYILFIVVSAPIAVVYGISLCLMYSGWARWVLIPYCIGFLLPFMLFGIIISLEQSDLWMISPPYVLPYCVWIVVIGWPLAYGLIRLIARRGIRSFGDIRILSANEGKGNQAVASKDRQKTEQRIELRTERSAEHSAEHNGVYCKSRGFAALYQLDRSRFRYYESKLWARILVGVSMILCVVVAFFAAQEPLIAYGILTNIYMFPVLFAVLLSMNRALIERKNFVWWLGFPMHRSRLLLSHITAVFMVTVRYMLSLTISFWVGVFVAFLVGKTNGEFLLEALPWNVYSLTLNIVLIILSLSLLQLVYFSIRSPLLSILLIPLYWLILTPNLRVKSYFYSEPVMGMDQPLLWGRLGFLVLITIPISIFCIWLGGRNFHRILDNGSNKNLSLFGKASK